MGIVIGVHDDRSAKEVGGDVPVLRINPHQRVGKADDASLPQDLRLVEGDTAPDCIEGKERRPAGLCLL